MEVLPFAICIEGCNDSNIIEGTTAEEYDSSCSNRFGTTWSASADTITTAEEYVGSSSSKTSKKEAMKATQTIVDHTSIRYDSKGAYIYTDLPIIASTFNAVSDIRLKSNIKPINDAISTINKINCVEYIFKERPGLHYGVIAQQIEEIENLSPLITECDRPLPGIKTVNYTELIPWLIKSVQELSEEVVNLREELNNLEK